MSYTTNLLAGMYNNKFYMRTSLSIVGPPYILTKCLGSRIAAGSTNQEPTSLLSPLLFPPTKEHMYYSIPYSLLRLPTVGVTYIGSNITCI